MSDQGIHGRGASWNPKNRFETLEYVRDEEAQDEAPDRPPTSFMRDPSRSIITTNDSPDVGFDTSINPYRGCEHGCIYCFARPTHEYLGFSAGLDFETKIMVKEDAPALLREELSKPSWTPRPIAISGVTDCYQPIERKLRLTRACLEVLADCRNPAIIITKNALVTRDIDVLQELARHNAVHVYLSITTVDEELARIMEPRTSAPRLRIAAVEELSRAGIPVGVLVAPIIPAINDHDIPAVLNAVAEAGARSAGYTLVRLPWAVAPLLEQWLEEHFPDRKEKVLNRIREIRGGKLNDPRWGSRLKGEGLYAEQISRLFKVSAKKAGLANRSFDDLSIEHFRRPSGDQIRLF